MINPKPCPYCGRKPFIFSPELYPGNSWFVKCYHCSAQGPLKRTQTIAIRQWNRMEVRDEKEEE